MCECVDALGAARASRIESLTDMEFSRVIRFVPATFVMLVAVGLLVATVVAQTSPQTSQPYVKPFKEVEKGRLHNAHVVTDKIISGAQPDDEAAFAALRDLGVRSIISVDGAAPNVALAKKFGMRYVHLPIGYDGVPEERGEEIAKAMQELPGPIYVHCHHGKHRSAAAVAVACVYNGMLASDQAEDVLRTFGTGKNYKGLWQDARGARRIEQRELDAVVVAYVEVAKVSDLAGAMLKVDLHNDHLKEVQKAGWKQPPGHPDLDPAHEALQLQEHYREIARLESVADRPEEFREMLGEAEQLTAQLGEILRAQPVNTPAADATFKRIADSCTACHQAYRD
jgi:protein tyrosine phosphatase (PTP) superfamily phosphohydrolase (DUF442 family)